MKVIKCNECPARFEIICITDDEIQFCPCCGSPLEDYDDEEDLDFEDE